MPIEALTTTIAQTTTIISLISIALFGLAWIVGSLLRGSPIPFKEWKEAGHGLQQDALKSTFLASIFSAIVSLIAWIASVLASAA